VSPRLVLITGASEGIGRAAALRFAARGDRVVAVARGAERLASLASEAGAGRVIAESADVADPRSMDALSERVLARHGVPDVVVANAGIGLDARFCFMREEDMRAVFEVNVFGLVRTVKPFLPGMLERRSGRVLLVSSIVGKRGIPHYAAYSASKFALHGLADALRAELWRSGVSVGVVCPASTETAFADHARRAGPPQRRVRPRRHTADSVAQAIVSMAGSRRRERILGVEAKLLTFADLVAPGLVDAILARALTR
jgi:short-subunit dehydrogenase